MPACHKVPVTAWLLAYLFKGITFFCRTKEIAQILTRSTVERVDRGEQWAYPGTAEHISSRKPSWPKRWTSSRWRRSRCWHFHSWTSWWRSSSHRGKPRRTWSGNRHSCKRCFSSHHKWPVGPLSYSASLQRPLLQSRSKSNTELLPARELCTGPAEHRNLTLSSMSSTNTRCTHTR